MFKVTRQDNCYKVSIGDGHPVRANILREVHIMLDHYYHGHLIRIESCPFCIHTGR